MVEVTDAALQQAAGEWEWMLSSKVFTDAYKGVMAARTDCRYDAVAHPENSIRCWRIRYSATNSWKVASCQLYKNGYGGYIFANPFAKVMRLWEWVI